MELENSSKIDGTLDRIKLLAGWARGFEPVKLTKRIVVRKKGTFQGNIDFGGEDDDEYGGSDDDFDDEELHDEGDDDKVHDGDETDEEDFEEEDIDNEHLMAFQRMRE